MLGVFEFWLPWITIALVLGVPATLYGYAPARWAVYGVTAYVASYFISNSWHLAFFLAVEGQAYGLALRWKTMTTLVMVVIYLTVVYRLLTLKRLPLLDAQAKLVWLILLMSEGYAVLEYAGCKLWDDPFGDKDIRLKDEWGISAPKYACERVLGTFGPYVAPITTTLYLGAVNLRARKIWIAARTIGARWRGPGGSS